MNTIVAGNKIDLRFNLLRSNADLRFAPGTQFLLGGQNIIQKLPSEIADAAGLQALFYKAHYISADPNLLPLKNYGGPTETMPPIPGKSVAIDGGRAADFDVGEEPPTRDQRNFPRGSGVWGDIGAVEFSLAEFDFATGKHVPGNVYVDTDGDELDPLGTDGAGVSLREAIRDVAPGGSVFFLPSLFGGGGTISLDAAKGPIVLKRDVTIDARATMRPGSNALVQLVAGSFSASQRKRVIEVPLATGAKPQLTIVTLIGLSLENGLTHDSYGGGGLVNLGGDVLMIGCRVANCISDNEGGGMANYEYLTLDRCLVGGNTANMVTGILTAVGGGGVSNHGVLYAQQCWITGNGALKGGAIDHETVETFVSGADAKQNFQLVHCTVVDNTAVVYGGGISAQTKWTLTESIVARNTVGPAASDVVTIDTMTNGKSDLGLNGTSIVKGGLLNFLGQPFTRGEVLVVDPGFVSGSFSYQPGSSSPAIDKGSARTLRGIVTSDFFGRDFVKAPDLGAFEGGSFGTSGTFEAATAGNPKLEAEITAALTAGGMLTGSVTANVPVPAHSLRETRDASQGGFKSVVVKFRGQLDASGYASINLVVGGQTLQLQLQLTDGALTATLTDPVSGDASSSEATSPLTARAKAVVPPTIVGRYSVVIGNLATEPPFAFGTLTVAASRAVRFVGTIGDGTKASFGARLNRNFRFRGRAPLYGGKGFLRMHAALDPEGIATAGFNYSILPTNRASILRPGGYPDQAPAIYANGFARTGMDVSLHRYVPPAKGQQATESFKASAGAVQYGQPLYNPSNPVHYFQLAPGGKATSTELGYKFTLFPATGLFTGTEPSALVGGKPIPFFGVILQTLDTSGGGLGARGFGAGLGVKLDPNGVSAAANSIYVGAKP